MLRRHLIVLFVVNIIFALSGVILNLFVIASLMKSSQLRKKLCHFMVVVISFFDLINVITGQPLLLAELVLWMSEENKLLKDLEKCVRFTFAFVGSSLLALLVMSIERYLGAYHPIFHQKFLTKRRLLLFLAFLIVLNIAMNRIATLNNVARCAMYIVFSGLYLPPFLFVNYKLFTMSRKLSRDRATSFPTRQYRNLKSVSTCLLVVASVLISSIPSFIFLSLNFGQKIESLAYRLSFAWARTMFTMNCSLNFFIFFWKNNVLYIMKG